MKDTELLEEFTRIERASDGVRILVRQIAWEGPHTPVSTWVIGTTLPAESSENDGGRAAAQLLEDARYFGRCGECGERNPTGWMHDRRICQACAEKNHGTTY